jgi:hypothetical protein
MGQYRWKCLLVTGTIWAALSLPSAAKAEVNDATRAAARGLGVAGVNAYQGGDYATAHDKLERAYQLLKAPSLGLWSARALQKIGKLVEAGERYLEVTRLPTSGGDAAIQVRAQADARSELDALTPQIPSVVIRVDGADAASVNLTLDGEAVSSALIGEKQPVNPGKHSVVGTLGKQQATSSVTVAAGDSRDAVLHFQKVGKSEALGATPPASLSADPATAPPAATDNSTPPEVDSHASTVRTVGWVAVGVGGAGLVFGTVTGLLALSKHSSITRSPNCDGLMCLASESSTVNSYNSLRTLSSVGLIAGGVLGATGAVLILTSHPQESASTALLLGPTSAALRGQF